MSSLVADLADRRLLDTTTIVWMGEFGRTPRINQNAGRDHWPRSWSVVVGGGGMKNGQVVGATDKDGVDIVDRPIGVMDLIATIDQDRWASTSPPSTPLRAAGPSRSSTAASRSKRSSANRFSRFQDLSGWHSPRRVLEQRPETTASPSQNREKPFKNLALVRVTGAIRRGPWRTDSFHTAAKNKIPTMIAANQSMAFTVLDMGNAGVSRR